MKSLPVLHFYCQNQIACRFLYSPSKNEPLIVTIPGGPGLSGRYLDHFLIDLAQHTNLNIGIMDLPNHGESVAPFSKLPLSYKHCFDLIDNMLNEIAQQTEKLILFGQSFGARLVFDLLAFSRVKIIGGFLTGFPYKFQMSEKMMKKISSLNIIFEDGIHPEENFKKSWVKILPHYTFLPLSDEVFDALTSNTKIQGNEHILDEVPDIEVSMEALSSKSILPSIGILQGDADGVVPDDNFLKLKHIVPQAQFFEIEKCGHFPMVENPTETIRLFSQFYLSLKRN